VHLDQRRLKQAEKLGAVPVPGGEGAVARVLELTGGNGVNVAIDAVGAIPAISTALACVALGGTVGLVGVLLDGDLPVTAKNLFGRQVTIVPVTGNPYAANDNLTTMITAGRIEAGIVIDHEAPCLPPPRPTSRSWHATSSRRLCGPEPSRRAPALPGARHPSRRDHQQHQQHERKQT
jgi:threonine dehydrogenase-like Zn-dependent dehydrogenase